MSDPTQTVVLHVSRFENLGTAVIKGNLRFEEEVRRLCGEINPSNEDIICSKQFRHESQKLVATVVVLAGRHCSGTKSHPLHWWEEGEEIARWYGVNLSGCSRTIVHDLDGEEGRVVMLYIEKAKR